MYSQVERSLDQFCFESAQLALLNEFYGTHEQACTIIPAWIHSKRCSDLFISSFFEGCHLHVRVLINLTLAIASSYNVFQKGILRCHKASSWSWHSTQTKKVTNEWTCYLFHVLATTHKNVAVKRFAGLLRGSPSWHSQTASAFIICTFLTSFSWCRETKQDYRKFFSFFLHWLWCAHPRPLAARAIDCTQLNPIKIDMLTSIILIKLNIDI